MNMKIMAEYVADLFGLRLLKGIARDGEPRHVRFVSFLYKIIDKLSIKYQTFS